MGAHRTDRRAGGRGRRAAPRQRPRPRHAGESATGSAPMRPPPPAASGTRRRRRHRGAPLGGWAVTASPPGTPSNAPSRTFSPAAASTCASATARRRRGARGHRRAACPMRRAATPSGVNAGVGVLRAVGPAAPAPVRPGLEGRGRRTLPASASSASPPIPAGDADDVRGRDQSGLWTRDRRGPATGRRCRGRRSTPAPALAHLSPTSCGRAAQGATPTRLWVAVRRRRRHNSGVWFADNWTPVNRRRSPSSAARGPGSRTAASDLAVAPSDPRVAVRAGRRQPGLADRRRRADAGDSHPAEPARRAGRLQPGDRRPSHAARADHPRRPDVVRPTGSGAPLSTSANVTGPAGRQLPVRLHRARRASRAPTTPSSATASTRTSMPLRFVPVAGGGTEIWVGCDGGVFRSRAGDADNRVVKRHVRPPQQRARDAASRLRRDPSDGRRLHARGHSRQRHARARRRHGVARAFPTATAAASSSTPCAPRADLLPEHTDRSGTTTATPRSYGRSVDRTPTRRASPRRSSPRTATPVSTAAATRSWCPRAPAARGTPVGLRNLSRVVVRKTGARRGVTLPSLTDPMAVGAQSTNNVDACVSRRQAPQPSRPVVALPLGLADAALRAVPAGSSSSTTSWPTPPCPAGFADQDRELSGQAHAQVARTARRRRRGVARAGAARRSAAGATSPSTIPDASSHGSFYVATTGTPRHADHGHAVVVRRR